MKKKIIIIASIILVVTITSLFIFFKLKSDKKIEDKIEYDKEIYEYEEEQKNITKEDIEIIDIDGKSQNYSFVYKDETYNAIYTIDNWKIIDSYKITNTQDIIVICTELNEIHKVHGKDMVSFRTPEDMAYEWLQHNIAYQILPDDNPWKDNAKDVDLDPKDQGKNLAQIYEDRTGKKFDLKDLAI